METDGATPPDWVKEYKFVITGQKKKQMVYYNGKRWFDLTKEYRGKIPLHAWIAGKIKYLFLSIYYMKR